jgi:hypothetical protein
MCVFFLVVAFFLLLVAFRFSHPQHRAQHFSSQLADLQSCGVRSTPSQHRGVQTQLVGALPKIGILSLCAVPLHPDAVLLLGATYELLWYAVVI